MVRPPCLALLLLLLPLTACDLLSPDRRLKIGSIADIVAPDSIGRTDTLRFTLMISRGACQEFDHIQVQDLDAGFLFTSWVRDLGDGSGNCPDNLLTTSRAGRILPAKRRDPTVLFADGFGGPKQKAVIWR